MRHRLSWKSPPLGRLLAGLCLVAGCLLGALPTQAADILLTGAEDNPGVQSFVRALSDMRPADSVRFQPLASLPSPGKLPAATRLILLDLPSLDWRQQEAQGPATLVLRISRLQAQQRFGVNVPPHLSLLWSDPPLDRQLRLTRLILPAGAAHRCAVRQSQRIPVERIAPGRPWAGVLKWSPSAGITPMTAAPCRPC